MTGLSQAASLEESSRAARVLVRGLVKTFGSPAGALVRVLHDVDLDVAEHEAVALTGPSGSGKSTLLHLLGAMLPADSGSIVVGGTDITSLGRRELVGYRRTVGFVFQRFQLLPALSALGNVLAPVTPYRRGRDIRDRAVELLEQVGLGDRLDALPATLSGGQQQRVAVARALIAEPALLLADEPTGNLDSTTGAQIIDLLLAARDEHRLSLVIATHDRSVADRCDRIVKIHDGQVL